MMNDCRQNVIDGGKANKMKKERTRKKCQQKAIGRKAQITECKKPAITDKRKKKGTA